MIVDAKIDWRKGKAGKQRMRKQMKQQMAEVMESLQELCQVIVEKIRKADSSSFFPLLQECQQLAVEWGESIEKIEGTGT